MNIPIQNIYFLLCYAWDKLEERDIVAVDAEHQATLLDLLARVLVNGTTHLLKRGLDRGYVQVSEETNRLRGRISIASALKTNGLRLGRLPCEFDELSYDVLHNRILKATLGRLLRARAVSRDLQSMLVDHWRRLSDVRDVELSEQVFNRVQLHRNNRFYDFLLKVCALIHGNLLPVEGAGHSKFRDFSRDEQQMGLMFEAFVRNFYRAHLEGYVVKREDIYWQWSATDDASAAVLPKMQTDVSISNGSRKLIIDCKFTPHAVTTRHEGKKARSEHLYQISAYMNNLAQDKGAPHCEAMLLYPTVDHALDFAWTDLAGRRIRVRTLNLAQDWRGVHEDLLRLV